jgi:uncharacterized protein with beta-barrel porin domain
VTPAVHAKYVYDALGEDRFISGALTGAGGSFVVQGPSMGRSFAVTGLSLSFQHSNYLRFIADYSLQVNDRMISHTGSGGLEVRW